VAKSSTARSLASLEVFRKGMISSPQHANQDEGQRVVGYLVKLAPASPTKGSLF
jgi:hypothetical protein